MMIIENQPCGLYLKSFDLEVILVNVQIIAEWFIFDINSLRQSDAYALANQAIIGCMVGTNPSSEQMLSYC